MLFTVDSGELNTVSEGINDKDAVSNALLNFKGKLGLIICAMEVGEQDEGKMMIFHTENILKELNMDYKKGE